MVTTITESISELHAALCDYIEATYHISNPKLIDQRRELFNTIGIISQRAFLESTPKYVSGNKFDTIAGLPSAALALFNSLSESTANQQRLIFNPPYKHQLDAIRGTLVEGKNLMIMTGTGSGKTESFLLPILGKLAKEAHSSKRGFNKSAVRALILYPMNALVNDQLGRIRNIFRDERLQDHFKEWSGRIPTFGRYTSRTPYPGVRDKNKDQRKLKSIEEFYVEIEQAGTNEDPNIRVKAERLMTELKRKGKWPAKPNISAWYGSKGSHWQDGNNNFLRAITRPDDSELITRQEVQAAPPDVLVTNYSMLEYMLMRPIERSIFEQTSQWLAANPDEKFLIVIDEAHLYRGAAGAEVGLLIRRLRTRLNIPKERLQVICSTASFTDKKYALQFASQLSGVSSDSFVAINSEYALQEVQNNFSEAEIDSLSEIDLGSFYKAVGDDRLRYVNEFLSLRGVKHEPCVEVALFKALKGYGPIDKLINISMGNAIPINELGTQIFSNYNERKADKAITALLALGSLAKLNKEDAGIIPCRVHTFFRGLPGLWACINPNCSEITDSGLQDNVCGKLYSQPRSFCNCGARVFEMYTCRNCGTAHVRAYTDSIDNPSALWSEPGKAIRLASSEIRDLYAIDLLLETPTILEKVEAAELDIKTGRLNPNNIGDHSRRVYIRRERQIQQSANEENDDSEDSEDTIGMFVNCSVCGKGGGSRESAVQDHQTKGDQPFLSLLSRQLQIQPPNSSPATKFAPLRGRKVLIFSDSRQVAAKLAPNLQMYSLRDSIRPLLVWGYKKLQSNPNIASLLCLDDAYLAVLIAANHFGVRLRPELSSGHNFYTVDQKIRSEIGKGILQEESKLFSFFVKYRNESAPESLLKEIVNTINDKFTGLEALAIASLSTKSDFDEIINELPNIPGIAENLETKSAIVQFWVRNWQRQGYWLKDMPGSWWKSAEDRSKGGVRGHKGNFKAINKILSSKHAQKIFLEKWLPELKMNLTDSFGDILRISGKSLSLNFSDRWVRCKNCTSVHRPIPNILTCLDCKSDKVENLNSGSDTVFNARKGYYRNPVLDILSDPAIVPFSIISAEHTAQLNAPENDDVFSKAEENELLFQDINLEWPLNQSNLCAIDILSCTTTMEVGIDIGALSGVALRNMPPGRANYQQRAGRAGRRGNALATVVSFGSVDSHDEHYFSHPQEMISGDVVDPIITLNNIDITRRHVRAFLLQKYHQYKLPEFLPSHHKANLFSVLGSVRDFVFDKDNLNRENFISWLESNRLNLTEEIQTWIPSELSEEDKADILQNFISDCVAAIDDAIDIVLIKNQMGVEPQSTISDEIETMEDIDLGKLNLNDGLLDRLLYRGKLPRYAFPTDVATFHVFDAIQSSPPYNIVNKFAPSQGLPIALSQYAPGKQVWISNKCYSSGALYSPIRGELAEAWQKRKLYYECQNCGFAKTIMYDAELKREAAICDACGNELEKAHNWMRPPGFAHPINEHEETTPDGMPDVSYASRAKLYMTFPNADEWIKINDRIDGLKTREHLLVTNTGLEKEGYHYCVRCGKIESEATFTGTLHGEHPKPFPDENPVCEGGRTSRIVLGTDFITDICLFSIDLSPVINLLPGNYTTNVALRTLCEALAKAGAQILEIELSDIVAEYRPALTTNSQGRTGEKVEIFLYDTLPGGAGFSTQLIEQGEKLFQKALEIMESCIEDCDSSCYRCLRAFKNKFEHNLLDRHIGIDFVKFILSGQLPEFNKGRIQKAAIVLLEDLNRNNVDGMTFRIGVEGYEEQTFGVIHARKSNGIEIAIEITNPLTPNQSNLYELLDNNDLNRLIIIPIDEFLVRNNLPSATQVLFDKINHL